MPRLHLGNATRHAAAILPLAAPASSDAAELAAILALLVAVCFAAAWVLRLGWIADYLSRPVLIGYIHGVAVVLIIGQLGKLLGLSVSAGDPPPQLWEVIRELGNVSGTTVAVSAVALTVLLLLSSAAAARSMYGHRRGRGGRGGDDNRVVPSNERARCQPDGVPRSVPQRALGTSRPSSTSPAGPGWRRAWSKVPPGKAGLIARRITGRSTCLRPCCSCKELVVSGVLQRVFAGILAP